MARFFIDRPIFAMVIAIVTIILGLVAIPNLPVATYPEVVPPVVQITANYRGGNSQDLEKTVAQPIEQQLVGSRRHDLLYVPELQRRQAHHRCHLRIGNGD
jgi:multidrug efflux pump subunit AcrB